MKNNSKYLITMISVIVGVGVLFLYQNCQNQRPDESALTAPQGTKQPEPVSPPPGKSSTLSLVATANGQSIDAGSSGLVLNVSVPPLPTYSIEIQNASETLKYCEVNNKVATEARACDLPVTDRYQVLDRKQGLWSYDGINKKWLWTFTASFVAEKFPSGVDKNLYFYEESTKELVQLRLFVEEQATRKLGLRVFKNGLLAPVSPNSTSVKVEVPIDFMKFEDAYNIEISNIGNVFYDCVVDNYNPQTINDCVIPPPTNTKYLKITAPEYGWTFKKDATSGTLTQTPIKVLNMSSGNSKGFSYRHFFYDPLSQGTLELNLLPEINIIAGSTFQQNQTQGLPTGGTVTIQYGSTSYPYTIQLDHVTEKST